MSMSSADRQRAYRQRHLEEVEGSRARLNIVVEHDAALALRRLASQAVVRQAQLLRDVLMQAQRNVTSGMGADAYAAFHSVG